MAILMVNGTALPNPQSLTVSVQDVDYESGRDQSGVMFRDRRRGGSNAVRKIEVKFPPLTDAQVKQVLQAVGGASMTLTYPDPYTGRYRNATVYVGDRKAPVYYAPNKTVDPNATPLPTVEGMWQDLAFNFIEF